jgi:hypothetical protein
MVGVKTSLSVKKQKVMKSSSQVVHALIHPQANKNKLNLSWDYMGCFSKVHLSASNGDLILNIVVRHVYVFGHV